MTTYEETTVKQKHAGSAEDQEEKEVAEMIHYRGLLVKAMVKALVA